MMARDFREALQLGEILKDEFIVDAHAHMDTWYNFHIPEQGTAASMVHAMDLLGIDVTILAPHICIGPDYCQGNRDVYTAAQQFPGRILPFVTINPNYPIEAVREEIEYWDTHGGRPPFTPASQAKAAKVLSVLWSKISCPKASWALWLLP
jgi:predicted TIM-barrel fold metal-dependent hydrolase